MEHHRLRKYRGPETWARVRQAYVAGESAPSLVRRFDVGYANLRRRARIEGWTRKAFAAQIDLKPIRGGADDREPALAVLAEVDVRLDAEPVAPREALARAVRRAAWLLDRGKTEEAGALLKTAQQLDRLSWAAGGNMMR